MKVNIYIDGNNLYRSAKELGFTIDYKKFRQWLSQKYSPTSIYLFIGFVPQRAKFYSYLEKCGYVLVFKRTHSVGGITKGNCDAELVLKAVSDFYNKSFETCLLITGDGDFACLVDFLMNRSSLEEIIAPDRRKCSIFLRSKKTKILFLNDHYGKFSFENKKAPDAD